MPSSPSLAVAAAGGERVPDPAHESGGRSHRALRRSHRPRRQLPGHGRHRHRLNVIGSTLALAGGSDGYLLVGRGLSRARDHRRASRPQRRHDVAANSRPVRSRAARLAQSERETGRTARRRSLRGRVDDVRAERRRAYMARHASRPNGISQAAPGRILDWTGNGYGAVDRARSATQTVVVTDALRAGVSTNIDPVATLDGNCALLDRHAADDAAGRGRRANGYAVIWNEFGPDGSAHLYLRRFTGSSAGADRRGGVERRRHARSPAASPPRAARTSSHGRLRDV